jgi:hypothetical protein
VSRLRRSLNGEKLAIGVDRLDYSKGLVNRINAFDRMWSTQRALLRSVSLLQIATLSRGSIEAYGNLQAEVARLVSEVNGRHGEVDWTPIRYQGREIISVPWSLIVRAGKSRHCEWESSARRHAGDAGPGVGAFPGRQQATLAS